MTDHDAFLRAILAAPADDAPRLIYADWLEEAGRPARAAFIRVQCALDAGPPDPARREPLVRHETALVLRHLLDWDREFAAAAGLDLQGPGFWDWGWRRGFVDDFVCGARQWLAVGAAVRALQPVRQVKLSHWAVRLSELGHSPAVAGLDTLRLAEERGDGRGPAVLADAAGGALGRVRRLELDMPVSPDLADRVRRRLPAVEVILRSGLR